MPIPLFGLRAWVAVLALGLAPSVALGQDIDLREIFSNDRFFRDNGILQSTGDVGYLADVWYLPGDGATQALLGVSLSNANLKFERTSAGVWQANYVVEAALDPDGEGEPIERRWEKSVDVETFDETMLTGETIVFQAEVPLDPGAYGLELVVRDLNDDEAARVDADLEVPDLSTGPALAQPVLLRLYRTGPNGTDFVVNPSHYYSAAPERFEFLVDVVGLDGPTEVRVRLVPVGEAGAVVLEPWSETVTPDAGGNARVFGSIDNQGARFGEFRFEAELVGEDGAVLASESTPLLISGSGGWISENWEDALSLIRYEATDKEMEILEDIEGQEQRVEAWNCFWLIRDPVPATPTNEALQDYFRKLAIANAEWTSALRPGYMSDRGRVFITLGAPDEIAERPVPAGANAFEVWTYHRYNFQILFVDRIGFNNYQLENVATYQRELATIERRKRQFLEERAQQCPLLAPAFE